MVTVLDAINLEASEISVFLECRGIVSPRYPQMQMLVAEEGLEPPTYGL